MSKLNYCLAALFVFICFCPSNILSDYITLNNGNKYYGIITQFADGKYVFKAGNKVYYIPEKTVKSITWEATMDQLYKAYEGDRITDLLRTHSNNTWAVGEVTGGYFNENQNNVKGMLKGGMFLSGVGFGFQQKTGRGSLGDGSVPWVSYFMPSSVTINLLYGSNSGSISYLNPASGQQFSSSLSSDMLILMINCDNKIGPVQPNLYITWGVGFGGVLNTDTLGSYPLGWSDYSDYPQWMLDPGMIVPQKVSGVYPGMALNLKAGAQFQLSDKVTIKSTWGYMLLSKIRYDDPSRFGGSISTGLMAASVNAGGFYMQVSAVYQF
jgi:hypothetical protein